MNHIFDRFRKPKVTTDIQENTFECKRDGLTIRGTEYRPEGAQLPIAIVCHGFMAWQDSVKHYARLFAELGYASYCFDFNGGSVMKSKSDGKTTDMSVLTEVADLESVIDFVRALPYVNGDQITLMGCSQGGLVSALVAAKNQYPIQKLSLFYPAFCIPDDTRAGNMLLSKFDPNNIPETLHCGPMKVGRRYVLDVIHMNPFDRIKTYCGQVCIIHGTADKIVNIQYAKRAVDTYRRSTPDGMRKEDRVRFHIIEGGAHMFSKKHDVIAMKLLKAFLSENTGQGM